MIVRIKNDNVDVELEGTEEELSNIVGLKEITGQKTDPDSVRVFSENIAEYIRKLYKNNNNNSTRKGAYFCADIIEREGKLGLAHTNRLLKHV